MQRALGYEQKEILVEIAGKVAVVTGAAGGIGAAVAQALVDGGARVVLTDMDADRVAVTAEQLGPNAASLAGDASSSDDINTAIGLAQELFGPVDMYVANAGVGLGAGLADDATWDLAWQVNAMAHVRAAQLLVPGWVERGEGYFVSTASAAGLLTQLDSAPYSVTKHAAVAFAEWLAVTYGDKGVRVSCLCPMGVDTQLLKDAGLSPLAQRAVTSSGEVLTPEVVANQLLAAVHDETFLVLPHPEVGQMEQLRVGDRPRWIRGMQKMAAKLQADGELPTALSE